VSASLRSTAHAQGPQRIAPPAVWRGVVTGRCACRCRRHSNPWCCCLYYGRMGAWHMAFAVLSKQKAFQDGRQRFGCLLDCVLHNLHSRCRRPSPLKTFPRAL
jgi:hypothetical protein